jgi:hypothetical protein
MAIFRYSWVLFFLMGMNLNAQQVKLTGKVIDEETGKGLPNAFVIDFRTNQGVFCDLQGNFNINIQKTDTLIASLSGYYMQKFSLKDSVDKESYRIQVKLKMKTVQLRTFEAKAPKTFDQIIQEADKLEQQKQKSMDFVSAIESPITYLYMQFNRNEKSKRRIAELRRMDAKRDLVKEVFSKYMVSQILEVPEEETDEFINYANLLNILERFETEYDLVFYIKTKWFEFKRMKGKE